MSILDITETPLDDDSIQEYEYIEYLPVVGDVNNLNNSGGDIKITIETQDVFTHPSESYLLTEGKLTKTDDTAYANEDQVALTNNGIIYLFNKISYDLSGSEIERIAQPGWATTILGLLKYDDNFSKSRGLNQLWYKDTSDTINDRNIGWAVRKKYLIDEGGAKKGKFELRIPLKHIFGFCEDYDKVIYGVKHNLTLTRAGDNDAIYRLRTVPAAVGNPARHEEGKVTLQKIAWYVPHVLATDKYKMQLYKLIENKDTFPVNYRMIQCDTLAVPRASTFNWRLSVKTSPEIPRFIIVGFQTGKQNNQETNPALFDHCKVLNIHTTLVSTKYPKKDYTLSFTNQKFSRAYGDISEFKSKFFLTSHLDTNPNFTPLEYRDLYPLFLFDVKRQSKRLKYSVSDIHIKADFEEAVSEYTHAYCVLISDRLIKFQSDGNKMVVAY